MTVRSRLLSLCSACLLGALPVLGADPQPTPAPETLHAGAPPEALLSPPPEAEKAVVAAQPSYVELANPAFPRRPPPALQPVVDAGPRFDEAALAPYFIGAREAEAKAAFDRGAFAKARMLLAEVPPTLPTRYLAALAAVESKDHARSSVEMAALAAEYPAMRDRALTHGGMAFSALGQLDRAVELLAQVPEDSRMYPEARVELGRALRRKKDPEGAIRALMPLAERAAPSFGKDLGAAALLEIADIAALQKDTGTENDALESIWAAHPLAPEAELAEIRLKKRPRTLTARVVRAESLVDAHRNKQGLELLEPLLSKLELPDPLACRAHFIHGKALRKERQHTAAIARLAPVVEACLEPGLRARALYVLGSSSSIVDQDRGIEVYRQLARDFPEHSFADDALFFAADLLMKRGRLDEALVHLAELARLYPEGDFAGEALFKSYWVHRTRGEVERGLALLSVIETRYENAEKPYDFERARYWRARTLLDQGKRDEALALFHRLAVEHPATYYGLSARQRTLELDSSRAEALNASLQTPREGISPWPLHAGPLGKDPHFITAIELFRLGFPQAVASELLAANRTGVPAEATRLIVFLLDRLGDERAAHAVARISLHRDLSGRITPQTRRVWEVAFPLAFRDLVEKHTGPAKVPTDLLQGLMREESALDPNALSWAGALGLVQLMPSTARAVAAQLKLRRPLPKDLLDPDLNLKLGATYLGGLIERFDGELIYAVASYNAGPGAISRWRRDRPGMPLDAWVEEIPIAETRGYVKKVLRSFNTYQLLYAQPAATAPVSALLPASVPATP